MGHISFDKFRKHLKTSLFVGKDINLLGSASDLKWRYINIDNNNNL